MNVQVIADKMPFFVISYGSVISKVVFKICLDITILYVKIIYKIKQHLKRKLMSTNPTSDIINERVWGYWCQSKIKNINNNQLMLL
jgi:hypothetical protein